MELLSTYGPFLSRKQAQEQGLKHYYTGKPCKNQHVSVRGVKKWNCLECDRNHKAAERVRDPERVRANERKTAQKHSVKKAAGVRAWRERNPEYCSIKGKERWEAIKADPEIHEAHSEKMRVYWMNKRREEGTPTWDELQSERLNDAIQRAESFEKVKVLEVFDINEGKRDCIAQCKVCYVKSKASLATLSNGQGIMCNCKKSGEIGTRSLLKMISTQKADRTSVYLVPTTKHGLQKYGITSNVSQRFSAHRHSGLITEQSPTWEATFDCRWKALLWEDAMAHRYSRLADRSLSPITGFSEVVKTEMDELQAVAALIALEVFALTETTWQAWASEATPRLVAA